MNKYQYKVQGVDYDVEIVEVEGNVAKVNVNGIDFEVEMKQPISPANVIVKPKVEVVRPVAAPVVGTAPAPAQPAPVHTTSTVPRQRARLTLMCLLTDRKLCGLRFTTATEWISSTR